MTYIAVCDDDKSLCSKIESIILEYSTTSPFDIDVEVFYSGSDFCKHCKLEHEFDLVFLDVVMGEMSGKEVGELIRKEMNNKKIPIAYMSVVDWYTTEFSNIQPFRFFKKPLKARDITESLDDFFEECAEGLFFEFKVNKGKHKIAVSSILYFESNNKKVKIKTLNSDIEFYGILSDIKNESFAKSFINIHKSYFVNSKQIAEYHFDYIIMNNGTRLDISRSNQKAVREKLLKSL